MAYDQSKDKKAAEVYQKSRRKFRESAECMLKNCINRPILLQATGSLYIVEMFLANCGDLELVELWRQCRELEKKYANKEIANSPRTSSNSP